MCRCKCVHVCVYLNAGHHALEAAEIDVGTLVELIEDLVGILLHFVLDVHFTTALVLLTLAGEGVIQPHLVGVLLLVDLELLVIEKGIGVGNTQK